MIIEIKRAAEETIIELVGRLDTTTAPDLDKTINQDIADVKDLVIDIKGLQYISSAGLRVLLGAQKKMQKVGSMKVTNVCEEIMEVFEMTGFSDILTIELIWIIIVFQMNKSTKLVSKWKKRWSYTELSGVKRSASNLPLKKYCWNIKRNLERKLHSGYDTIVVSPPYGWRSLSRVNLSIPWTRLKKKQL